MARNFARLSVLVRMGLQHNMYGISMSDNGVVWWGFGGCMVEFVLWSRRFDCEPGVMR